MPHATNPLEKTVNIGGTDWTIAELLQAIQNLSHGGGQEAMFVRNPLDFAAASHGRENAQFSFNPRTGQIVYNPTDTWSELYGTPPGSQSVMDLYTPEGYVPVPVSREEVNAFLGASPEIQQKIAGMTPEEFDAFRRWNVATSGGEGGAGVRDAYGVGGAATNPMGDELARMYERNLGLPQPRQLSERERQRRAEARAAVQSAANTPQATAVIKEMLTGTFPYLTATSPFGGAKQRTPTIQTLIAEMAGRGAFGQPIEQTGIYPNWAEYFSPGADQKAIATQIGTDYDKMLQTKAMDIVARRNIDLDSAMRLAQRQMRKGYLGSVKGDTGGMGLSTWG